MATRLTSRAIAGDVGEEHVALPVDCWSFRESVAAAGDLPFLTGLEDHGDKLAISGGRRRRDRLGVVTPEPAQRVRQDG